MGEDSGEEQLFSLESYTVKDNTHGELERYLEKLKDCYGLSFCCEVSGVSPQRQKYQVLDALVRLLSKSFLSAETLWAGGWLLCQLLPHGKEEFTVNHLKQLKDAHKITTAVLREEIKGSWSDMLLSVLRDEWRNCKRAIEASSPQREPKCILLASRRSSHGGESLYFTGEKMCEAVKVFVLQRQLLIFSSGGSLPDQPPLHSPMNSPVSRRETAGLDVLPPKLGSEINLDKAVPCRIAFERGKERHLSFLAISKGTSGWILLSEELPHKQQHGIVRVTAPLAGSDPRIDEKRPKWLHLRIRPYSLPYLEPSKNEALGKGKAKVLVDGRWTLAFRDEKACKAAESMVIEEMNVQQNQVEERLKPLLDEDIILSRHASSSSSSASNSPPTSSG